MLSSILVIVPFLVGINAANDWSVPCTTGSCSYDLPATNGSASGTMKIWGSDNAITDITTAADWQILGCNSTALAQDVRIVCMNGDSSDPNSKCAHLYQNIGAVNKIVRLPENCGASAFARVAKSWVPDDQTIPSTIKARIVRRDGKAPVVKALSLDTNFDAVDWSKTGMVNIAVAAANVPGAPNDIQIPGSRRSRFSQRGFGDLVKGAVKSVTDGVKDAGDAIKGAADTAASDVASVATKAATVAVAAATKAESVAKAGATKVKSVAKAAATDVKSVAKAAETKVESVAKSAATKAVAAAVAATNNTIDVNKSFDLPPLNLDKSVNLINQSLNCGPVSESLSVDMDANANAQVTVSVAAAGTIVPPKLTSMGVVAGVTANVAGTLTMNADISGHLDSGSITLLNVGIPGFDFPGILTVGPSFQVAAEVVGDVDVTMDMTVGLNFNVNNAQLSFPPDNSNKPNGSAFSIGDTPLTLNADPSVQATGTITAHLIPSLNLGVSALGGKAQATIFLNLDTNAALTMSLDGSGDITKTINPQAALGAADNSTAADDSTAADNSTATDDGTADDGTDDTDDTTADDGTDDSTDTTADDGTDDTTTDDGTDDSTGASLNSTSIDNSADGSAATNSTTADDGTDATDDGTDATDDTDDTTANNSTTTDDGTDATDDSTDATDDDTTADDGTDDTTADDGTDDTTADDGTDDTTDTTDDSTAADDGTDATDDATDATDDSTDDTTADDGTDDGTDATLDPTTIDNSADTTADNSTTTDDGTDSTDATDDATTPTGTTTSTSFGGCVGVTGTIDVNAGVNGDFFGLFDKTASAQLFTKTFNIFNKCFGDQATGANATATDPTATDNSTDTTATRRRFIRSSPRFNRSSPRVIRSSPLSSLDTPVRRAFSCPVPGAKKSSVTKGTVKASTIKSK